MLRRLPAIGLGGALVIAAFSTGADSLFFLLYLGLLVVGGSYLVTRFGLADLEAGYALDRLNGQVGEALRVTYTIRNAGRLPKLWLEAFNPSTLPVPLPGRALVLGPRAERSWAARVPLVARGHFRVDPLVIRTGDPFGLFEASAMVGSGAGVTIYPRVEPLPRWRLPASTLEGTSATPERTSQATPLVTSIRPYAPGDAYNRIHWKSSARHQELQVKEFDLEQTADLWIYLDLDRRVQAGEGDESTLEAGGGGAAGKRSSSACRGSGAACPRSSSRRRWSGRGCGRWAACGRAASPRPSASSTAPATTRTGGMRRGVQRRPAKSSPSKSGWPAACAMPSPSTTCPSIRSCPAASSPSCSCHPAGSARRRCGRDGSRYGVTLLAVLSRGANAGAGRGLVHRAAPGRAPGRGRLRPRRRALGGHHAGRREPDVVRAGSDPARRRMGPGRCQGADAGPRGAPHRRRDRKRRGHRPGRWRRLRGARSARAAARAERVAGGLRRWRLRRLRRLPAASSAERHPHGRPAAAGQPVTDLPAPVRPSRRLRGCVTPP